jgi:ABC-type oligopeptide transport system ATPase subunit
MGQPVVKVDNLAIAYETRTGDVNAVREVSFEIHRGETLGLVGESGCGKSTVAYGLVNYLGRNGKIVKGDILFQGQSLVGKSQEELRKLRGDQISMVYQDPMTSLNPVLPDRRADDGGADRPSRHAQSRGLQALCGHVGPGLHARSRQGDGALPPSDFGRATTTGRHRHGDAQQPGAAGDG